MQDTQHVVYLSTNISKGCEHCRDPIPYGEGAGIGEWINHYIGHGYKLLHVGSETDGEFTYTVAVMGK